MKHQNFPAVPGPGDGTPNETAAGEATASPNGSRPREAGAVAGGTGEPGPVPPPYVPVRAMEDILALRAEQIVRYGHTSESDAERPMALFALDLRDRAKAIHEALQFHQGADILRKRLVRTAALCMAMIDKIDAEDAAFAAEDIAL